MIKQNASSVSAMAVPTKRPSISRHSNGQFTFVCNLMPEASQACVAGDFNAWNPEATPMERRDGHFEAKVALTPGEHEYKFVVDGQWLADPAAPLRRPNPFGTENSVVRV